MATRMRSVVRQALDRVREIGPTTREHPVEGAIRWIRTNRLPGQGIVPYPGASVATQEVTGYTIPSLYRMGEKALAREFARWEAAVQRSDGAVAAIDGVAYTFDTAQAARGFLAVLDDLPEMEDNLRRACDFVAGQIDAQGVVHTPSYDTWKFEDGTMLSEYGNLYVLPPLVEAGERLGEKRWIDAARRAMDRYRRLPDLVEFKPDISTLSHYFGYMMEALVDLGELDLAARGLEQAEAIQRPDGAIPAYPGVDWVCSTGLAQLAIAWYKLGRPDPADRAMDYLEGLQNRSGGFYGSYGAGARYFPTQEISWAAKFFIDAYALRVAADFDRERALYAEQIAETDGRVRALLEHLSNLDGKRVLDVGCGKGRYLLVLQRRWPTAHLYGVDVSRELLASCPQGVETRRGTMLDLRYPDGSFDAVYTVEALEHAILIENAVRELVRVLRPGGALVIIDKNAAQLGRLSIKRWERWFRVREMSRLLERYGVSVTHEMVAHDEDTTPDGLFVAWKGIKQ